MPIENVFPSQGIESILATGIRYLDNARDDDVSEWHLTYRHLVRIHEYVCLVVGNKLEGERSGERVRTF